MPFGGSSDLGVASNSESAMRPVGSAVVALSGPLLAMNHGMVTMDAAVVAARRSGRCGEAREQTD